MSSYWLLTGRLGFSLKVFVARKGATLLPAVVRVLGALRLLLRLFVSWLWLTIFLLIFLILLNLPFLSMERVHAENVISRAGAARAARRVGALS